MFQPNFVKKSPWGEFEVHEGVVAGIKRNHVPARLLQRHARLQHCGLAFNGVATAMAISTQVDQVFIAFGRASEAELDFNTVFARAGADVRAVSGKQGFCAKSLA